VHSVIDPCANGADDHPLRSFHESISWHTSHYAIDSYRLAQTSTIRGKCRKPMDHRDWLIRYSRPSKCQRKNIDIRIPMAMIIPTITVAQPTKRIVVAYTSHLCNPHPQADRQLAISARLVHDTVGHTSATNVSLPKTSAEAGAQQTADTFTKPFQSRSPM